MGQSDSDGNKLGTEIVEGLELDEGSSEMLGCDVGQIETEGFSDG